MIYRHLDRWGILFAVGILFLSSCTQATPTPIIQLPVPTSVSAPSFPTSEQPIDTEEVPTEEPAASPVASPADGSAGSTTPETTGTAVATATQANPLELPFLMKIDRVSVVVGRGTLLEGRVAHGTLPQNGDVEILGPQSQAMNASALATLVSGIARDQVTVGDYAGILVDSVDATKVVPGMLVSEAEAYPSYEEALQVLQ